MDVFDLAKQLIALPSITPDDAGCQELIASLLQKSGFKTVNIPRKKVENLWAVHGDTEPLLVFAGHTDVVSTGPTALWKFDPFTPTESEGMLYGRGVADMKGSLAAFIIAACDFVQQFPQHRGSLGLLITSGEEGRDYLDGTPAVLDYLAEQQKKIDWCIVGEPGSFKDLGDNIRVGRRGSLTAHCRIFGTQGHVAYPHLVDNPIHRASEFAHRLTQEVWDSGNDFFPATSLQITNFNGGDGSSNVVPSHCDLEFNFRFSPESNAQSLEKRVTDLLGSHRFELKWSLSGEPFFTNNLTLISACQESIRTITQKIPKLSTCGGTSDGRFIAKTGADVIEMGLINATIHQVNECVRLEDIKTLQQIYFDVIRRLL